MPNILNNNVIFQVYDVERSLWFFAPGWFRNSELNVGDMKRDVKYGVHGISWGVAVSYSSSDYENNLCRLIDDQTLEVICYMYNGYEVEELDMSGSDIVQVNGKFYKKIDS